MGLRNLHIVHPLVRQNLAGNLKLPDNAYDVDQEFEAIEHDMPSPSQRDDHGQPLMTHYTVYPVELWVAPNQREPLRHRLQGQWLACDQALAKHGLSPTARWPRWESWALRARPPCDGCPCMKPERVKALEALKT